MELPISREELINLYTNKINAIFDTFDDHSGHFSGEQACLIMYNIIKDNGTKISIKEKTLYAKYMNKVFDLHLSDAEWKAQYGIKEICNLVYDILETA